MQRKGRKSKHWHLMGLKEILEAEVAAHQSGTSWCSAWLEGSSSLLWMQAALLYHVTASLNHFLCINCYFLGGTRNICHAMNIVLQWMLDLWRCNCAFVSERVLCNVSLTSAFHIAAICLGLCFGFRGDSVDWNTSVNILLNFHLKPWWEQCWTKAVVIISALCTDFLDYFHVRLKCSIQFMVHQQSTWLTNISQWEAFHGLHFWELASGWTEFATCVEGTQNS